MSTSLDPNHHWLRDLGVLAGGLYAWAEAQQADDIADWYAPFGAYLHDRLQPEDWQVYEDAFVAGTGEALADDAVQETIEAIAQAAREFELRPFKLQPASVALIGGLTVRPLEEVADNAPGDLALPSGW